MAKPIEFTKTLGFDGQIYKSVAGPINFKHVELICKDYNTVDSELGQFDVILAYDDNKLNGILYLGHWNDGIVE